MSEQPQLPSRFISLRWKTAYLFLLLLIAVFSTLSWRLHSHLQHHLNQQLQTIGAEQAGQINQFLLRNERELLAAAEGLGLDLNDVGTAGTPVATATQRAAALEKNWSELQRMWQLASLQVVDNGGSATLQLGAPAPADYARRWAKTVYNTREPTTTLLCYQRCRLYAAAPLLAAAADKTIIVSRDLATEIGQLNGFTSSATGIIELDTATGIDIPAWNARIITFTDTETNVPLLQSVSQSIDRRHALLQPQKVSVGQKTFAVSLYPNRSSSNLNAVFVALKDISNTHGSLLGNIQFNLLLSLALAAVFAAWLIILSWRHIDRFKLHAELLPRLGQKQFQEVRERIAARRRPTQFKDELDVLDDAVTTLSFQLESLEKTVDVRAKEMERLSLFDPLTGLANRNLFQYELQRDAQRLEQHEGMLAVLLLDLDKFKRINDSLGHQQGDMLLGKIGERLKHATKTLGLVARLGGDEFAVLVRRVKKYPQISVLTQKVLDLIHQPIALNNESILVSCSVGVCIARKYESATDLVKHAELAMYKAKESGGNSFRVFDQSMAAEAHNTLSLESEIRRALKNREFTLYLQPKVNMDNGVEGFESLVRWDHPDRGILPPGEFIPAMENMGLISELDNWVLEASCRQLKTWQAFHPNISIAVNISSTHFTDKNFLAFLHNCLQKYPINPSQLELEITETLLMENMNAGLEIINHIKELGVSIAIDDFGTGYSSLSYLKRLPVDTLKIDREFIKDIPESGSDMQISSVIIFLAKQLNFKVVAEGVETSEQLVFLKANQCDLAQGFYFSEPIPAHKAMIILESQRLSHGGGDRVYPALQTAGAGRGDIEG